MPAQNPTYDLMLLLDTAAEEEQRTKVLAEAERILESNSATIVSKHDWGVRRTAFEIRHKNDAEYHLLQFQGGPEVPAALDRYLRIADGVVRFRVIKLRAGLGPVPDLRAANEPAPEVRPPRPPPLRSSACSAHSSPRSTFAAPLPRRCCRSGDLRRVASRRNRADPHDFAEIRSQVAGFPTMPSEPAPRLAADFKFAPERSPLWPPPTSTGSS